MLDTNSTTIDANQQWATLAKQQDFWKAQAKTPWLGPFLHPITHHLWM